jgi:hypothetical protein
MTAPPNIARARSASVPGSGTAAAATEGDPPMVNVPIWMDVAVNVVPSRTAKTPVSEPVTVVKVTAPGVASSTVPACMSVLPD